MYMCMHIFKSALLRYSFQAIKCTHYKYTFNGFEPPGPLDHQRYFCLSRGLLLGFKVALLISSPPPTSGNHSFKVPCQSLSPSCPYCLAQGLA